MLARFCVGAALVAATALVYAPVGDFGFVGLDDTQHVAQNAEVLSGLTPEGVRWAFTTVYFNNWHPLTWLSLMLDVELFGARPGALHLVNAGLHALNAVLLFLLLARFGVWQSAFVAAVFCVHRSGARSRASPCHRTACRSASCCRARGAPRGRPAPLRTALP